MKHNIIRINVAEYCIFLKLEAKVAMKDKIEYAAFLENLKSKFKDCTTSKTISFSKKLILFLSNIFQDLNFFDWQFQKLKTKILKLNGE